MKKFVYVASTLALLMGICAAPALAERTLPYPPFPDTPQEPNWGREGLPPERGCGTSTAFMHGYGEADHNNDVPGLQGGNRGGEKPTAVLDSLQFAYEEYVGW